MTTTDALDGFEQSTFHADGKTKPVYRMGSGPAVIVIHEVPGLTPKVAAFARRVADAGFSVTCPVLLGTPGKRPSPKYLLGETLKLCISKEIRLFAAGGSSPVVTWLRALAVAEHQRCGGPGVGTVGMCFSGGFALAMATEPSVIAPVMSQPSLPAALPWRKSNNETVDLSPAELATIKARMSADEELCVLAYRFTNDPLVPAQRFDYLKAQLGDRFHGVSFDSSPGNPSAYPLKAHSVLSEQLVESAATEVIEFFQKRLT